MKVYELIDFLKTQPQELDVVYRCCSEYCELEVRDITIERLCLPRGDGWVANQRPDRAYKQYLAFPGN